MSDWIYLQDQSTQRGEALGHLQRETLKRILADFKTVCDQQKVNPTEVPDRARRLSAAINTLVPEWLMEARACATTAQIPAASYMALSCPPDRMLGTAMPLRAGGSAAFGACGGSVAGARAMLLDNATGPAVPTCVLSRASTAGSLAYVALSDVGDTGIRSFVNEAGLAGTFHIGPQTPDISAGLFLPSLVLRQICERATSCMQAVQEFENLRRQVELGTPDRRGVLYLFADASGMLCLMEAGATRFLHQTATNGSVAMANRFILTPSTQTSFEPARQRLLRELLAAEPMSLERVVQIARLDGKTGKERPICAPDTRTSFVAVLGTPGLPGLAVVNVGSPARNLPFAVWPGAPVPRALADGTTSLTESTVSADSRQAYEARLVRTLNIVASGVGDPATRNATLAELWKLRSECERA